MADILFDAAGKDDVTLADALASQRAILNRIGDTSGDDWEDIQSRVMQKVHILEALVEFHATE